MNSIHFPDFYFCLDIYKLSSDLRIMGNMFGKELLIKIILNMIFKNTETELY